MNSIHWIQYNKEPKTVRSLYKVVSVIETTMRVEFIDFVKHVMNSDPVSLL